MLVETSEDTYLSRQSVQLEMLRVVDHNFHDRERFG